MIPDCVRITESELVELKNWLDTIVEEFEEARARASTLEGHIGDPFGRHELREAAEEFEDQWNDRRFVLKEDLGKIAEHVQGVLDGFYNGDLELAQSIDDAQQCY